MKNLCKIEGCEKFCWGRGLCSMHYQRWRQKGDPLIEPDYPKRGGRPRLATECKIEGCEKPGPYTRGWCQNHYTKWVKYGDPLGGWIQPQPFCSVDGCDRPFSARGWCKMHYNRWQEHGDVGEATPLRAESGVGSVNSQGYRIVARKLEHRTVMEMALGRPLTDDETVHHINGDRLDNRIQNLQLRQGKHGNGVRFACLNCGSHNVEAVTL